MNKLLLSLVFIICVVTVMANPVEYPYISEFWQADNGHVMLELPQDNYYFPSFQDIMMFDGTNYYAFPPDYTFPADHLIDLTALFPDFVFNPQQGSFGLVYLGVLIRSCTWGTEDGNVSALLPNESIVRLHYNSGEGTVYDWVKDSPPTPGTQFNFATARATLNFHITNQHGMPAAALRVYMSFLPYGVPAGATDDLGNLTVQNYVSKIHYWVVTSDGTQTLYSGDRFVEMGINDIFILVTDNADPVQPPIMNTFTLCPNPFSLSSPADLSIKTEEYHLYTNSSISIYDTKGRLTHQSALDNNGRMTKPLPQHLHSGIYFADVREGKRTLATQKLLLLP